jgi:hypothetical protein
MSTQQTKKKSFVRRLVVSYLSTAASLCRIPSMFASAHARCSWMSGLRDAALGWQRQFAPSIVECLYSWHDLVKHDSHQEFFGVLRLVAPRRNGCCQCFHGVTAAYNRRIGYFFLVRRKVEGKSLCSLWSHLPCRYRCKSRTILEKPCAQGHFRFSDLHTYKQDVNF